MESNPQLIANKAALADDFKRRKIEQVAMLLEGALRAEAQVGVKMNVPADSLEKVLAELPAITSPTIAHLRDQQWYSVEIVIAEATVRDLVPRLVAEGVQGIVEYPLNKVI
jgi:ATP phosphoribosyltransferase